MGPWQVVLIIAAILLLFGGRKIPELMKGLGGGIKEFKKAANLTGIVLTRVDGDGRGGAALSMIIYKWACHKIIFYFPSSFCKN